MTLIDSRLFPDDSSVFACSGNSGGSVLNGQTKMELQSFLTGRGITENTAASCVDLLDMLAEQLRKPENAGKDSPAAYWDLQAYTDGAAGLFVNIRLSGKTVYDRLAGEAGKDAERKLAAAGLKLYSRFGAEITFINIRSA